MSQTPKTKKAVSQFRGPADSTAFNQSSEDLYQDLVYLYNKSNELDSDVRESFSATSKIVHSIGQEIARLRQEVAALNAAQEPKALYLTNSAMRVDDLFIGGSFEIPITIQLSYDPRYRLYSLPKNVGSSISRLTFTDPDGNRAVPPSLEMVVAPNTTSSDNANAIIRTSQPFESVLDSAGRVWERNVIQSTAAGDAEMDLMFSLPVDLASTEYANVVNLIPFPVFGVDITGIYYTTEAYPDLSVLGSTWTPLNNDSKYFENNAAVGSLPPGSWAGDEILDSPPLSFIFPSEKITAMRITIRQRSAFSVLQDGNLKYQFSYGISHLDVRYDKFETSGKAIFELTPHVGDTISAITSVQPYIYNVNQAGLADVFSYRIIWETSPSSGVYTTTPVPLSAKAYLEVTLQKDSVGNIPALTGFKVVYS